MSEFKGTPGPWQVTIATYDRGGREAQKQHISIFDESGYEAIASYSTEYSEYPDDEVNAANARLIAAAPELLEACQTFAEWLRREEGGFPAETRFNTPEGEAKWREWFDENLRICDLAQTQARAAIAKATGEPQ